MRRSERWRTAFFRLAALIALAGGASIVAARDGAYTLAQNAAAPRPSNANSAIRILYAPSADAAEADVQALSAARASVDFAAYVLTDHQVIAALAAAAKRGARVRVYLDRSFTYRGPGKDAQDLANLAATPGASVKFKNRNAGLMHLKSYQIDGRLLRTGSSNFSYSGARMQDNDIIFIEGANEAQAFSATFERLWARSDNEDFAP